MTLFELLFILLFLGSMISLVTSAFRWRRGGARKILAALFGVWCVYLVILAITDVFSSQKIFKNGQEQCFDEMCFALAEAQTMPAQAVDPSAAAGSTIYVVKIRATSHSRGRAQAESGLRGRLYDGGMYINVSDSAQKAYDTQHGESPKLTQKIAPGESIVCILVFEAPQGTTNPTLTLDHGFTPGYFVIGESPFFHNPDIHQLPRD